MSMDKIKRSLLALAEVISASDMRILKSDFAGFLPFCIPCLVFDFSACLSMNAAFLSIILVRLC